MLWGLYGTTALQGLLRYALSGRATPEVMAGLVDQVNLIQHSYGQAAQTLQQFMGLPEAQEFPAVPTMVRTLQPLDRVYVNVQQPMQVVTTGVTWDPGPVMQMVPIRLALMPGAPVDPGAFMGPGAFPGGDADPADANDPDVPLG